VNEDGLKLTVHFGERSRAGGRLAADALVDVFARHELQTSIVMRGIQGFGARHGLRSDRLLTLSEDLPLAAVAVDSRPRIERAMRDVVALRLPGLVTLERARMITGRFDAVALPEDLHEATKLTVYVGRYDRAGGRSTAEAIVDLLHRGGVAGATVLLGVDGTAHGVRRRARMIGANARVPLMIVSVGEGRTIAPLLGEVGRLAERPVATLERVHVCRRDGLPLVEPPPLPETDPSGLAVHQKLMVYIGEDVTRDGRPAYRELVMRLRRAGAAGATSLRGIWGYHGDHAPHGDTLWQLRRRVPVVTVVVDRPHRTRRWLRIAAEVTGAEGLITSEMAPALHAAGSPDPVSM
jgi:PII-like signaling protein